MNPAIVVVNQVYEETESNIWECLRENFPKYQKYREPPPGLRVTLKVITSKPVNQYDFRGDGEVELICPICGDIGRSIIHHITYKPERTVEFCEGCHKVLSPIKRSRLLKDYEKSFVQQLYLELGRTNNKRAKQKIQQSINEILQVGRNRFNERNELVVSYIKKLFPSLYIDKYGRAPEEEQLVHKNYRCEDCGRPLSHLGRCLRCNRKRKREEKYLNLTGVPEL